jgi:hypothetical protein
VTAAERPDDRLDDRGRPCLADSDPTIRTRCMQLRDAHMSLRGIAQVLAQDYPEIFERPPSPTSVAKWADQGVEEWERLFGQAGRDALDAAKVRPRKIRRLHRLMGQVALAARATGTWTPSPRWSRPRPRWSSWRPSWWAPTRPRWCSCRPVTPPP